MFFDSGDSLKNLSSNILDNASDLELSRDLTYLTNTLLLSKRQSRTNFLMRIMQFLHFEVELLTIWTTAWLSQKMITLRFVIKFDHVTTPTVKAYNSKNSMLGSFSSMKCGSHWPYVYKFPKTQPKPLVSPLLASV